MRLVTTAAFHPGCHLPRGDEGGVTGTNWAQRRLSDLQGRIIDFSKDAEPKSPTYYFKLADGLAYASQLFEVGIFEEVRNHVIAVPKRGDRRKASSGV